MPIWKMKVFGFLGNDGSVSVISKRDFGSYCSFFSFFFSLSSSSVWKGL